MPFSMRPIEQFPDPALAPVSISGKVPYVFAEHWGTSFQAMVTVIVCYLIALVLLKKWVAYRGRPYDLRMWVVVYNFMLSAMSVVLLVGTASRVWIRYSERGWFDTMCDAGDEYRFDEVFNFWIYMTFLSKYVELIDTVFLCLRGKPLIFLHVYHHAATIALAWVNSDARLCLGWVALCTNMCVHTLMYYYFAWAAAGYKIWWRRYLTQMQIVQFVIDLAAGMVVLYPRFVHDVIGASHPHAIPCMGTWPGTFMGIGIIFSYLCLFSVFYVKNYKAGAEAQKKVL